MCGICGKISLNSEIDESLMHRMARVLAHRGPDDEGVYIFHNKAKAQGNNIRLGLGHRRLSVIDVSSAGHQPMSNEDATIWLVMNGEIYNFTQLKKNLKEQGHIFRSGSDSEVILHLYEEKGLDCLKELRGCFAFALWDEKRERLFLARDRIGKKPLFYTYKNHTLIFASEIKSILQDGEVSANVNREVITDYLSYGYIPTPESMFEGIKKLPPAHFMIYENGEIQIKRYWKLDFSKKLNLDENQCVDRVMELLEDATKIRLESDVPLGVFLSGGIDSSAIVYMMSKISRQPAKTFSIGFEKGDFNELKYARIIAQKFNTDHTEFVVKPDAVGILPKLVWYYNEPYADSSALPCYYVANMARQKVTVALTGDGGDEDFGGYERFMAAKYAQLLNNMPVPFKNRIIDFVTNRIPAFLEYKDFRARLRRFLIMVPKSLRVRHYNWLAIFNDSDKASLFSAEFSRENDDKNSFSYLDRAFEESSSKDVVDMVMSAEINTNLLDDLLVKMDIATMANSLESRSPFLDQEMMEFCAGLPSNMKIRGRKLKYILKKALLPVLPKEILFRNKAGFAVPLDNWFRNELKDYAYEILLSDRNINRGYFNKASLKFLLDEHISGKASNGSKIWSLLNLELWHRIFIDKENL